MAWSGWGTALKPAWEPIILARKPLGERNVAANVTRYGTGAINVDGCRIGTHGGGASCPGGDECRCSTNRIFGATRHPVRREGDVGRWPANVLLDEDAAAMLDAQSGPLTSNSGVPFNRHTDKHRGVYGRFEGRTAEDGYYGDSGGASRFFYTAKADREDRDGSRHPTVKPTALMRYLITLVTPPGGVVLDPFCGSGPTVWAAREDRFAAIGCDREEEYLRDTVRRLRQGVLL